MTREHEVLLLDFCLGQYQSFQAHAWFPFANVSADELATAALYLAGTEWFGHRDGLILVARNLHPGCVGRFAEMAQATGFDPGRFAGLLKARILHARTT